MNTAAYLSQLKKLSPRGRLWQAILPKNFGEVLAVIATELARIDARAEALIKESDPRTVNELLADWEKSYGLPESCTQTAQTVQERIDALVAKVDMDGSLSIPFYIWLAKTIGYDITIETFKPWRVTNRVNQRLYGLNWRYVYRINAPATTIKRWTVTSRINEPLAKWGYDDLECLMRRLKPAHMIVHFSYGGN